MSQAPTTREYDTFGPWISRVTSRDDLPRLFAAHPLDPASADLVLKVPRAISRRDATPQMDLYDHVLFVMGGELTVLSRITAGDRAKDRGRVGRRDGGQGFTQTVLPVAEIASIHDSLHLLDGQLDVRSRAGEGIRLAYNGSARDTVHELIDLLKTATSGVPTQAARAVMAAAPARALGIRDLAPGEEDVVFVTDAMALVKNTPDVRLWTCHGRVPALRPTAGQASAFQRLARWVSPVTLSGAVLAADALALEVITRKHWTRKARVAEYTHGRIVVPWVGLDRIAVAPHAAFEGVVSVTLTSGVSVSELLLPAASDAASLFAEVAS